MDLSGFPSLLAVAALAGLIVLQVLLGLAA